MDLPAGLKLSVQEAPSREDRKTLDDALNAFNRPFFPSSEFGRLGAFVRDELGTILAGLDALLMMDWLYIDNLRVDPALRGRGIGRELMTQTERAAVARRCQSAWVDTFSFQAPGFYQKLGYEIFATLDYPPGHKRHFLRKRLAAA